MGRAFEARSTRRDRLSVPTKRAALIAPGDVIGYEGEWRKVKTAKTDRGPMGGLAIVVVWEDGGTARFPAGDELLLSTPDPN